MPYVSKTVNTHPRAACFSTGETRKIFTYIGSHSAHSLFIDFEKPLGNIEVLTRKTDSERKREAKRLSESERIHVGGITNNNKTNNFNQLHSRRLLC